MAFKKIKQIIKSGVDFGKEKRDEFKANQDRKNYVKENFKSESIKFCLHLTSKKTKSCFGILEHENSIIKMDCDKLKKDEIEYITDPNENKYYVSYINPKKFEYEINYGTEIITKPLYLIEYKLEAPVSLTQTTVNYNDYSTNNNIKAKGSILGSQNSTIEKKTNVNIDADTNIKV